MSVKIVEVCRVAPPPSSAAPKPLPITYFDAMWLSVPPAHSLLFYAFPHPVPSFSDSVLPKLKRSLSLTLYHFLHLAGKLVWPLDSDEPVICVDQPAVSLTVAESDDAYFHRLSSYGLRDAAQSYSLIPSLPVSETGASIMSLQITVFPNSGFAVGTSAHHAVMDGKTFAMFVKSWAFFCGLGGEGSCLPPELTPHFDRAAVKDPKGIKAALLMERQNRMGVNKRSFLTQEVKHREGAMRGTFVMTRAHIEKLRAKCLQRQKDKQRVPTRLSTFTLTCAYSWVCLIKTQGLPEDATVYVGFAADCRPRLNPPIPETYFGNCVGFCYANASVGELKSEEGVGIAAEAIGQAISELRAKGLPEAPEDWMLKIEAFKTGKLTTVAGSPQFGLYGTDFGWGGPRKFELASMYRTGNVELWECRDGDGGVEVGLVLYEAQMKSFVSMFSDGLQGLGS